MELAKNLEHLGARMSPQTFAGTVFAFICALLLALGAAVVMAALEAGRVDALVKQRDAARKSESTAWGKFYQLQDDVEDRVEAARHAQAIEVWNLRSQLEKCQDPQPLRRIL